MVQHQDEIVELLTWMAVSPRIILEIGAHMGGTTALFATLATELVISVDLPDGPFGGIPYEAALERNTRLHRAYPHLVSIVGDSHHPDTASRVAAALAGRVVDLLFIDGDHSLWGVTRDYEMYAPFVRRNGVIAFHDIVDSAFHRDLGVEVAAFWGTIPSPKAEFLAGADWGGIGAMRC
jgi:predicted O-methyltransferase YrrM